ncbi:MAG: phage minor capsid protein [Actinoplanes sp.]
MAVTSDQIAEISRATVDLYKAAEQAILREVTRRLADGMDAPDWAVTRLGALSTLRSTVQQVLALVLDAAATSIREALARAYRSGQAEATTGIPARLLPRDSDAVRAGVVVAGQVPRAGLIENLAAALVQDVGERHSNVVRHVTDVYRQVITEATAVSVAGGMTRRQASQHAYQKLIDQGVTSFTDVRGRRWRLSSYVEMGVRTVTQRAAVQGQADKQERLGLPFCVVSNEVQECEMCRPFEGQVLRIGIGPVGTVQAVNPVTGRTVTVEVVATLDGARARGLQHPNCRHGIRAYLPGVTKLPEVPTADPKGDRARQRQRAIERAIRKYKERELGALDPAAKAIARSKVRLWQGQMRDHLAANPALKRLPYREQIGAGNLPPGAHPAPAPSPAPPPTPPAAPPALPQRQRVTQPPTPVEDLPALLRMDTTHTVNREMMKDVFGKIIGGDYAGFTVEINEVSRYGSFGSDGNQRGILASGLIYPEGDLDANPVGYVQRGFYRDDDGALVAVHSYLKLVREYQGRGFASEFNGRLEDWYRQQDIARIEIHANIDVGGYTWAIQGYNFADNEEAENALDRLRDIQSKTQIRADRIRDFLRGVIPDSNDPGLDDDEEEDDDGDLNETAVDYFYNDDLSEENRAALDALLQQLNKEINAAERILDAARNNRFGSPGFPTATEIALAGRQPGHGRTDLWIGKRAMLGSDWQGVKWL